MVNATHFLIAGGIALICCAILAFYYFRSKQLIDEMWSVQTYDSTELKRMCRDGFDAIVEVQGAVACDKPITSPVSKLPCCWYHIKVRRQEEDRYGSIDDIFHEAKHISSADAGWITEMDQTYAAIFKVEDKTGYTLVDPTGADVEAIEVFNGIVKRDTSWLEAFISSNAGKYHVTEEVFLPTGYAYVLGQATKVTDDVMIHKPEHGYIDPDKRFFMISRKTEKELSNYKQITTSICFWFGVVALFTAVFCFLEGFGIVQVF